MSDELTNPHISAGIGHYTETVFPLLEGRQYSLTSGQGIPPCPNMVNAGAQFHWPLGCEVTGLININGGHSNAYIRNAGPGSVPKSAKAIFIFYQYFWPFRRNHYFQTLCIIVCRLVCFALLIAFQVQESILEHLF